MRDLLDQLAQQDPDNAVWQSLAASAWAEIGAPLLALDHEAEAVPIYAHEIGIRLALASPDPSNADWHADLAFGSCETKRRSRASCPQTDHARRTLKS